MYVQGAAVLAKYVALNAAQLVKANQTLSALSLFSKYGAPPNPQVHVSCCNQVYIHVATCTCNYCSVITPCTCTAGVSNWFVCLLLLPARKSPDLQIYVSVHDVITTNPEIHVHVSMKNCFLYSSNC